MASFPRFIVTHAHGKKKAIFCHVDLSSLVLSYVFDRVFFHSLRCSWLALLPWEGTGDLSCFL